MAKQRGGQKTVSKRRRFEIFKRDRFTCVYCGQTPPDVLLQLDHVIPRSKGGDNSTANLVTACRDCNSGKSNVDLDQVIPVVQQEIVDGQERLAQLKALNRLAKQWRREKARVVAEVLEVFRWGRFTRAQEGSVGRFLEHLPAHEITEAAEIALSKKEWEAPATQWKYFCGICWNKINRKKERNLNE